MKPARWDTAYSNIVRTEIKVFNLKRRLFGRRPDPAAVLTLGNAQIKETAVSKNTQCPRWTDEFTLLVLLRFYAPSCC
jgi:hypothetical protein